MSGTPVPVGAKTGSAEDPPHEKPHSWFVWFAPYDRPRYACAVVVEHAGHGAEVAGFVARDILFAMFAQTGPTASPTAEDVLDAD
jgi:cell division protein FtsI/penicillin-binding protein 2